MSTLNLPARRHAAVIALLIALLVATLAGCPDEWSSPESRAVGTSREP